MQQQQGFRFCCKVMEWPKAVIDVAEEGSIHLMQSLHTALLAVKQYKYEGEKSKPRTGSLLFLPSSQGDLRYVEHKYNSAMCLLSNISRYVIF